MTKKKNNDKTPEEDVLMREWAAMAGPINTSSDEDDEYARDAMAAEWEAMLGDGGFDEPCVPPPVFEGFDVSNDAEPFVEVTRVLNQDEIDSLLGFDDDHGRGDSSGIQALLNSSVVHYERLPILENIIEIFVRNLTNEFRHYFKDNVEVSIDNILSLRYGDYINSIPLPVMMRANHSPELDGRTMFIIDSSLIYSSVDILLGGRRGTAAMRIEGRPYTTVERDLISGCFDICDAELGKAFTSYAGVTFEGQNLETNPRFPIVVANHEAIIVAKIRVDMEDRGGRLELCIPYSTLEPILPLLRQEPLGERHGNDPLWHHAIGKLIPQLPIEAIVCCPPHKLSVRDVESLKNGDTLILDMTQEDFILKAGGKELGRGTMGSNRKKPAFRVSEMFVEMEQEENGNEKD